MTLVLIFAYIAVYFYSFIFLINLILFCNDLFISSSLLFLITMIKFMIYILKATFVNLMIISF